MKWLKSFWKAFKSEWVKADQPAEGSRITFTPRAQQALALAKKESIRLHHQFVGTEHILLGVIALGQGCAFNVLVNLGINPDDLRKTIEASINHGPDLENKERGNYTPRVKMVLAIASNEAKTLHHHYVGTEHLFLGLLGESGGMAGKILRENYHLNLAEVRKKVLKELDPNFGTGDKK